MVIRVESGAGSVVTIKATREQLAKLSDVLKAAFQDGMLPSADEDEFNLEIDDDPAIYCLSNTQALCWSVARGGSDLSVS
ncbi:MAG TPA: hypothetical protein V6C86_22000 [Oculatellaceae cyanobacterium]